MFNYEKARKETYEWMDYLLARPLSYHITTAWGLRDAVMYLRVLDNFENSERFIKRLLNKTNEARGGGDK